MTRDKQLLVPCRCKLTLCTCKPCDPIIYRVTRSAQLRIKLRYGAREVLLIYAQLVYLTIQVRRLLTEAIPVRLVHATNAGMYTKYRSVVAEEFGRR